MLRKLVVGLLLVAVGASGPLGGQAVTGNGAPTITLDPQLVEGMRGQLSAGYDQRGAPGGLLQRPAPDGRLMRVIPVIPMTLPVLAQSARARQCPMPVATGDVRARAAMPVVRADSTRLEKMPVARSACVNPLGPR